MKTVHRYKKTLTEFGAVAAATALGLILSLSSWGAANAQEAPILRLSASHDARQSEVATAGQMLARAREAGRLRVIVGF